MKKVIVIILLLCLWSMTSVDAQVTIGSSDTAHEGAVLDLKSDNKGLLLPNVVLKENPEWWALSFDEEKDTAAVKLSAAGMAAFNTADVQDGIGLYIWNGTKWTSLATKKAPLATYTVSGCTSFLFTYQEMQVTLEKAGVGSAPVSCQWYCDGNEIDGQTQSTLLLSAQTAGTHAYTCEYTNGQETKTTPAKTIHVFQGTLGSLHPITLDTNDGGTLNLAHVSLGAENYTSPCDMRPNYYQWGRVKDGHEVYNSPTTDIQADDMTAVTPAIVAGKFIITELDFWTTGSLPSTWTNPVCPAGWHVMTLSEVQSILPASESLGAYSDAGMPNTVVFSDITAPNTATAGDYFTITPKSDVQSPALLIVNKGARNTDGSYGLVPRWWIADFGVSGYQTLDWNTATAVAELPGFIGSGEQDGSADSYTQTAIIQSSVALGGQEVRCVQN